MEIFSLEEDTCDGLFLTQRSSQDNFVNMGNQSGGEYEANSEMVMDTVGPASSNVHAYSDISDAEDFQMPSSQIQQEVTG